MGLRRWMSHRFFPSLLLIEWAPVVRGILKGWDPLVNLVLDETIEELRGTNTRTECGGLLGVVIVRLV